MSVSNYTVSRSLCIEAGFRRRNVGIALRTTGRKLSGAGPGLVYNGMLLDKGEASLIN